MSQLVVGRLGVRGVAIALLNFNGHGRWCGGGVVGAGVVVDWAAVEPASPASTNMLAVKRRHFIVRFLELVHVVRGGAGIAR